MPHQCTACGHAFADGSKDMLGGCPDCGGNKFQFYPEGTEIPDEPPADAEAAVPDSPDPDGAASTVGRAATKVRDLVSSSPDRPDANDGHTAAADATAGGDPDPNAPWPDSSDAADPIRKGGFQDGDGGTTAEDDDEIIDADARAAREAVEDAEDRAQSDARSGLASDAEVASAQGTETDAAGPTGPDAADADDTLGTEGDLEAAEATVDREAATDDGRVVSEPTGEEPDLAELREQLNDQFESIKILEPGQYELNLMELYDREEYIIALQENGRYVIQVPENWMGDEPGE